MKKIKSLLILFMFSGLITTVFAQSSLFTVAYGTAMPLGKTGDYIENFSWRGLSIESRYFIETDLSVGFYFGWNVFNQKFLNHTQEFDQGVLYGNQYRYINAYPMLANAHYHFLPDSYIRPYIGGGIGVYHLSKRTEMGLWAVTDKTWHFGMQPEAGLWFDIAPGINFMLAAKYNYGVKTSKADAVSYLNINAGITFVY